MNKDLIHCLTCESFDFDYTTMKFKCKKGNVEPDEMIYAFERKVCDEFKNRHKKVH